MSGITVAAVIVAVIVIGVLVTGALTLRRRRLQRRFGPEYDRLVGQGHSKLKTESELAGRQRRVHGLDIHPLTDPARAEYTEQWERIQELFVDTPTDAVAASQVLVVAVMGTRGYPAGDQEQVLADLSVEHANTLDRYRAAEETSTRAAAGTASTEDLRLAMINYRALFRDLLGEPADAQAGPATAYSPQVTEGDNMTAMNGADQQLTEAHTGDLTK